MNTPEMSGEIVRRSKRATNPRLNPAIAVEMPGDTGARLYRRSDIEALLAPAQPEGGAA